MAHEKLRPEYFFDAEKIAQLKQIAPECFEDGKINFETLKQNLNDWTQNEEDPELEHFGLFWPGKRDARKVAALPPEGTLGPVFGDGLKADGTTDKDSVNNSKNIFIEGENLEVLKLLQKSYAGKIKMIYIDPPYNTGSDFVYDDDFTEPLQEYLRRTGQVDEEGKSLTTNKRSDGRFHSKWLSMMYPRLRLARNLLRDDGVIFVSIDDNEVHNLKAIMNEIFGEENFVANFLWKKKGTTSNVEGAEVSPQVDYNLCYKKTPDSLLKQRVKLKETRAYPNSDEEGNYRTTVIEKKDSGAYKRDTMKFEILGHKPRKGKRWQIGEDTARVLEKKNRFIYDGEKIILKIYDFEDKDTTSAQPNLMEDVGSSDSASQYVNSELFSTPELFDNPKPVELLRYFMEITLKNESSIILDFFGGSGSTADATLRFNEDANTRHKFITVQIPISVEEKSEAFKAGYKTIAEISKERIRRVIKSIIKENVNPNTDKGFKVLSLRQSNFKPWINYKGASIEQLQIELEQFNNNPLREDYSGGSLLTEILLLEGFTLCSEISILKEIKSNSINKITSEYCKHSLLICLDEKVSKETIASIKLGDDDIFICLDTAISTEDKLRLSDKGLIKTI